MIPGFREPIANWIVDDSISPLFGCSENPNPGMEKLSPDTSPSSQDLKHWIEAQDMLKRRLVTEDDFTWKLSTTSTEEEVEMLRYVGGVDISFSKADPSVACGTLVVLDTQNLQVVYEDYSLVTLDVPYVPGFLAFREAPILLELLQRMKKSDASVFYPQLLMVDGNGILHPRGFGSACHLGVLADLPTIGIGKNLHHVDGLTYSGVRQLLEAKENYTKEFITLTGCSGHVWGVAMRSTQGALKPIFVSVGHRVSLDTAIRIVKMTCKFRVPEPIRQLHAVCGDSSLLLKKLVFDQVTIGGLFSTPREVARTLVILVERHVTRLVENADIRSREYLRKRQMGMSE